MINYSVESFDQFVTPEFKAILPIHWREMSLRQAEIPIDPDYPMYEKLIELGRARIYTVRDDGKLVGYVIFFITPRHLHYDHRWASDDTIWLHPDYRGAKIATGLFDFFEADLTKDGPIVIQIETRFGHPGLDALVQARGYGPTGAIYGKRFT